MHRNIRIIAAGALAAWIACAAPARAQLILDRLPAREASTEPQDPTRPLPLVNADEDMADYLNKARDLIAQKEYARAIEILQALLDRREPCFVCTPEGRRYVSLGAMATAVTASLGPEGLRMYRSLYDAKAARLLESAMAGGDEAMLREVIGRYLNTRSGGKALSRLAAIQFDRGDFLQAARTWGDVTRLGDQEGVERPALLARVAVAHHFAGEAAAARTVLEELQSKHPDARAVLAGADQDVAAFVQAILDAPAPEFQSHVPAVAGWTSMAGAPDSVAMMSPCRPVLSPRWTQPGRTIKLADNETIRSLLGPTGTLPPQITGNAEMMKQFQTQLDLREGQVLYKGRIGNTNQTIVLPAVVHPLVVGNMVLYREATQILVYDMLTGEMLFRTSHLPLHADDPTPNRNIGYYPPNRFQSEPADDGTCTLTVGGDAMYAVGLFPPRFRRNVGFRPGVDKPMIDSSVLAAFSLRKEGALLWWTKDSPDEFLNACRFLSAPTYVAGKLYVVAKHTQAYYLLCLDARTGRMVWNPPPMVSQTPVDAQPMYSGYMATEESGSPPAVANGRVYACTNAGVLAAFEADTGRALWAYQYDSDRNRPARSRRGYNPSQLGPSFPANPIVVAKGRLICLPADSSEVLAVRADTGERLWTVGRDGQKHLAAVGEAMVLLSGPKLRLLQSADGQDDQKRRLGTIDNIHGRCGVTTEAILASGRGRVWYVPLDGGQVLQLGLTDKPDNRAMLGNLVCADGKLIAANSAGVSAYFTFAEADAELTARLATAGAAERPTLLHQRGLNAFNAGKFARALPDLLAAREAARREGLSVLLARTEQSLYRTYVCLANESSDKPQMLERFQKAGEFAAGDRARGEMQVRLIKYYSLVEQHSRAAELAQKLTEDFKDVELADIDIGLRGNDRVYDDEDTPRFAGYDLGHRLIAEMIDSHGQDCYRTSDGRAKAALDAALNDGDGDAMVAVSDRYRHSTWAPLALLRAAESQYLHATDGAAAADRKRDRLATASRLLSRINLEYPSSVLSPSASLGRAMVYRQIKPNIAFLGLSDLRSLPPNARVAFAGVRGTAAEVLRRFGSGAGGGTSPAAPALGLISPPLAQLYCGGGGPVVLRDADGRPVRAGKSLFILQDDRFVRFNPYAPSYTEGVIWEAPTDVKGEELYRYGFNGWPWSMLAGATDDGSTVVVACRAGLWAVDVKTGKRKWYLSRSSSTVVQMHSMAMGGDQLVVQGNSGATGTMTALDMATGKALWSQEITGAEYPWMAPPRAAGGLVVAVHGRTDWFASVYDQSRGKLLGRIKLGARKGQAFVTAAGLVVTFDGQTLAMTEPMLGMDRPVWEVNVGAGDLQPIVLEATDTHVAISPSADSPLVELRSLAHHGMIERTFQTSPVDGNVAVPGDVRITDDQVFVVGGQTPSDIRQKKMYGQMSYTTKPSLQAFDRHTGKLLWVADVAAPTNPSNYALPVEVGRDHVALLTKPTSYALASKATVVNRRTGKLAQMFTIAANNDNDVRTRAAHHMLLSSPVILDGRLLLETHKGIWMYGKSE
ncbi:MAG TPA: PQQ-binding-like beta-propeller repeat protein [Phycisphaerae bacterium]|nr:PQQ-binding-like beta-propeller repeat protein [Phycisphaerae bacterium]